VNHVCGSDEPLCRILQKFALTAKNKSGQTRYKRVIVYSLITYRTQSPYSDTLRMEAGVFLKYRNKSKTPYSERSQKTII
jgi:hypothetical protein